MHAENPAVEPSCSAYKSTAGPANHLTQVRGYAIVNKKGAASTVNYYHPLYNRDRLPAHVCHLRDMPNLMWQDLLDQTYCPPCQLLSTNSFLTAVAALLSATLALFPLLSLCRPVAFDTHNESRCMVNPGIMQALHTLVFAAFKSLTGKDTMGYLIEDKSEDAHFKTDFVLRIDGKVKVIGENKSSATFNKQIASGLFRALNASHDTIEPFEAVFTTTHTGYKAILAKVRPRHLCCFPY